MVRSIALLVTLSQAAATPAQPTAPVHAQPTAPGQPAPVYAPPGQPAPVYGPPPAPGQPAPVYGPPPPGYGYPPPPGYVYPQQYGPGYPPQQYGPPMDEDDRLEWLEKRHGSRYTGDKGKGKLVAGGLTLGFGALMGLSALTCGVTAAGLYDSGDENVGAMTSIAAGMGVAALLTLGAGIPLVIIGKKRRAEYRAWLVQQPMAGRTRLDLGAGGLILRF